MRRIIIISSLFLLPLTSQAFAQGFIDDTSASTTTAPVTTTSSVSVTNALGTTEAAKPDLVTTLEVKNLTQNKDAIDLQNRANDLLEVTLTLQNKGLGTLSNFIPTFLSEELFKIADLSPEDALAGLSVKANKQIDFPMETSIAPNGPIKLWKFKVRIKASSCTDFPQIVGNGVFLTFESNFKKIGISCSPVVSAVTTTTPIDRELLTLEDKPLNTTNTADAVVKKSPPKTPKTGPELFFVVLFAMFGGYLYMKKRSSFLD